MTRPAACPRCGDPVRPPTIWSSAWECGRHGAIAPYHVVAKPAPEPLGQLARTSRVPVWSPLPFPPAWSVTGMGWVGDGRDGPSAAALACSGPSPLGGPADLVLVAEELGVGLGARYAGLAGPDPGSALDTRPEVVVQAAGHETPLWHVEGPGDRCAFVGEAGGVWLWLVLWPEAAGLLLLEHLLLHDLRGVGAEGLVFGAPSPYLTALPS